MGSLEPVLESGRFRRTVQTPSESIAVQGQQEGAVRTVRRMIVRNRGRCKYLFSARPLFWGQGVGEFFISPLLSTAEATETVAMLSVISGLRV
jgi:hypothetical protein